LEHIYEEKYLHWADDIDAVRMMVAQFLKEFKEERSIPALFADREDRALALMLYRKTALGTETFDKLLESKVQNWDMDRIALTDMVLMRMALAEFLYLEEVPPKVTINEYIELSKEYSTPRSGVFINGLLDQCLIQLREEGQIKKVGRGLL
jgi:N utilization substance protein B